MIIIARKELTLEDFENTYDKNSIEMKIINILSSSSHKYKYKSLDSLDFELKLRKEIINASKQLNKSGFRFAVFHKSKCNETYWDREQNGGFVLKSDVNASDAIMDIYNNGYKYSTECATAMVIVYYKAILEVYSDTLFNKVFKDITLMNWHDLDRLIYEVGFMEEENDYLPADRRYFKNPDVDPITPQWQGENVIDLGNGTYYGHGIGIKDADGIVNSLNRHRSEDADQSAELLDSAGRPDFKKLEYVLKHNS